MPMSNEPENRSEWWMSPEESAEVAAGHRKMMAIQAMNVVPPPAKQRDWWKEASQLQYTKPHAWEKLYSDAIEMADPELVDELKASGEFNAFIKVKVSEALESYEMLLHEYGDPQKAKAKALSQLMEWSDDDDDVDEQHQKKRRIEWLFKSG